MADGRKKKRPGVEEQQQIIMRAAVPLLLDKGSQAVSIAQICEAADVSRPTFYRCFKDKEALLAHLYEKSVNVAVDEFLQHNSTQILLDPEQFHEAFDAMYEAIFREPELACLLFRESNDPNSPAYHIINETFGKVAQVLSKRLEVSGKPEISRIFLMSVMVAHQWIVHEAINTGLTEESKANAKRAGWLMVTRLFSD